MLIYEVIVDRGFKPHNKIPYLSKNGKKKRVPSCRETVSISMLWKQGIYHCSWKLQLLSQDLAQLHLQDHQCTLTIIFQQTCLSYLEECPMRVPNGTKCVTHRQPSFPHTPGLRNNRFLSLVTFLNIYNRMNVGKYYTRPKGADQCNWYRSTESSPRRQRESLRAVMTL